MKKFTIHINDKTYEVFGHHYTSDETGRVFIYKELASYQHPELMAIAPAEALIIITDK